MLCYIVLNFIKVFLLCGAQCSFVLLSISYFNSVVTVNVKGKNMTVLFAKTTVKGNYPFWARINYSNFIGITIF